MAPVGARASASAVSVSSAHGGCKTAATAARLPDTPVSARSCVSLLVEPAGRSRSDLGTARASLAACGGLARTCPPPPSAAACLAATSTCSDSYPFGYVQIRLSGYS
eukprot:2854790-Pleurochrysis_carterae.AAC.1